MATATVPTQDADGKWWMSVDPDDKNYVVWNVANDMTDRGTIGASAASVTLMLNGVTVIEGPTLQDGVAVQKSLVVAKITIDPAYVGAPSATARITCANTEQFDRTIHFKLEDH